MTPIYTVCCKHSKVDETQDPFESDRTSQKSKKKFATFFTSNNEGDGNFHLRLTKIKIWIWYSTGMQ